MMQRPVPCALLLAFGCAISVSQVAGAEGATPPVVQFGPIRFGMSAAEIQAAVPEPRWEITSKSEFTGKVLNMRALDALDYGGWRMNVDVRDHKYDRHVELSARRPVADAATCEQLGRQVLAALESSAGTLQSTLDPGAESVAFGQGSTAMFNGYDAKSKRLPYKSLERGKVQRMALTTQRESDRLEVKGQVTYDAGYPDNCSASVIAIGWSERPPLEILPYDAKRVTRQMNIGDRHRLASTLSFTSDAVVIRRQCQVSRQSGKVLTCQSYDDAAIDPAFANVAGRYAGAMRFDMTGLDRDDPQPVLVEIPVRVARSDVRPLDWPAALTPRTDIDFDDMPTPKELELAYPMRALRTRAGISARVELRCQVQADGSLICGAATVQQSDGGTDLAADFEHAAQKLVPEFHAKPALKNGQPSAGVVFPLGLTFQVAE